MNAIVTVLLLFVAAGCCRSIEPFKGTRTYNLATDADRYDRYERVLIGLRSSEGLKLDPAVLRDVREVLLREENEAKAPTDPNTVAIHLGKPMQSRHIAELLYRQRPPSAGATKPAPARTLLHRGQHRVR
ncbi:uncharacterized protein LOC125953921 [Anopheles darlingi]|uniref:uncharacterized protein LOC125953921 n=1 Tax=Anopheles darlingi TaxID=43151 RepID=UPI0021003C7A|nr:uncharacterized protein LOC125953921 [Anopheles darlingi]